MRFVFNEEKAAESAAHLLKLAGGTMPYIRLIKLMYLADRRSLLETGHPIVGDRVVSMDHGPVLSRVYDLIKGARRPDGPWQQFVSRDGYDVRLERPVPAHGVLSDYEHDTLNAVFARYRDVGTWALIDLLHLELAEWVDPVGSSVPIEPEAILRAGGRSAEEISEMAEEAAHMAEVPPSPWSPGPVKVQPRSQEQYRQSLARRASGRPPLSKALPPH